MAIRKVSRMGHPVLRQRAAEVPPAQMQSPQMQRLIDDMIETMIDYEGIGLAAPQVFEPPAADRPRRPRSRSPRRGRHPTDRALQPPVYHPVARAPRRLGRLLEHSPIARRRLALSSRRSPRLRPHGASSGRWKPRGFSPASSSTKSTISTACSSQTAWPIYRPLLS